MMPIHSSVAHRKTIRLTGVSICDGMSSRITNGSGSHPCSRGMEAKAASGGSTGPPSTACCGGCAAVLPGKPRMSGSLAIVKMVRSTASSRPCLLDWDLCSSMAPGSGQSGRSGHRAKRGPAESFDHDLGRSRGGFSNKPHFVTAGRGLPLAVHVTAGQRHREAP
jgi:hypothetical protein